MEFALQKFVISLNNAIIKAIRRTLKMKDMVILKRIPQDCSKQNSRVAIRGREGEEGNEGTVYSPGCGEYHLNRNRNSRSVLGIDYTIAYVRVVHINQIRAIRFSTAQRAAAEGKGERKKLSAPH